jgi:flagellar hook assembly protein FlgD
VGTHEISWAGTDDFGQELASGNYFCKMISEKGKVSMIKLLKMQ